jgi:2-succinyl-6-hydroxy-2,4-cyclohexadiene-1-carboxylate synthase
MRCDVSEWPVLRQGKGDQPVVLLHGFMGSKEDWLPIIDLLSPHMECLAFDLPGHGKNIQRDHVPEFNELVAELEQQRIRLGISRWHVAGYSMGGRIAIRYALDNQAAVHSLSVISASPGIINQADRIIRQKIDQRWIDLMNELPPDEFMKAWYGQPVFKALETKPELLRRIVEKRTGLNVPLISETMLQWGQGTVPSAWDQMASLAMPWQMVVGQDDQPYQQVASRVKNLFPGTQIAIVENAGHPVHEEQPSALASVLKNFIQSGRNI